MAEIEAWLVGMIQTPARKFRRKYRNVFHKKSYFTQFYTDFQIEIYHNPSRLEQVFFKNNFWKHLTGMVKLSDS